MAEMVPRTEWLLALDVGRLEVCGGDRRRFARFGLGEEMEGWELEEAAGGNCGVLRVEGAMERIGEMAAEVDIMREVAKVTRIRDFGSVVGARWSFSLTRAAGGLDED